MKWYKILFILLLSSMLMMGCKKAEDTPAKASNISENTVSQTEISVTLPKNEFDGLDMTDIPDYEHMTRSEFRNLSIEDIKKIAASLEDYRKIYKIDADRVMTDDDWYKLKSIMEMQLYGDKGMTQYEKDYMIVHGIVSANEADYIAPDISTIEAMDADAFAAWFNEAAKYFSNNEENFKSGGINLRDLTDDEILAIKENYIQMLKEMQSEED